MRPLPKPQRPAPRRPAPRGRLPLLAGACVGAGLGLAIALSWYLLSKRGVIGPAPSAVCRGDYDLVVRGGMVLDGLGHAPVRADVGVSGGRVACVGEITGARAAHVVEAEGLLVAPGFIDVHTHVERNLPEAGKPFRAPNFVRQGVTTIITGNCGTSRLDVGAELSQLDRGGSEVNVATFVGHNSVRRNVMQRESRAPSPAELDRMKRLVDEAMRDGALGLSTGLSYVPGTYAGKGELVALTRVAAGRGGIYVSHIRDEGVNGFDSVAEAISIGEEAGAPVHISHFKASGRSQWGTAPQRLGLVDDALRRGTRVTIDQYPYTASSTSLDVMLPSWALADDSSHVAARLRDPQTRWRVLGDMLSQLRRSGWDDYGFARIVYCPSNLALNGLTIPQAASARFTNTAADGAGRDAGAPPNVERQAEKILDLIAHGGAQMIYFDMNESDVVSIMSHAGTMFGSDSSVRGDDTLAVPHPRGFGTFPRVFSTYVRERHTLTLEEAVRRMTSLPAEVFGLGQRGRVTPGYWADLVVFRADEVRDRATYETPLLPPDGISCVVVNGKVVFEDGHFTEAKPGVGIRHVTHAAAR